MNPATTYAQKHLTGLSKLGIFSAWLMVVASASIATSLPAKAAAKDAKVILLTVSEECEYCSRHLQSFRKKAEEEGISLKVKITNFDPAEQASQVDQAIAERPDAIVLWPADASAIVPSLRKIKSAGIPIVVTNSQPDMKYSKFWDVYTGPNDKASGGSAAKAMEQGFKDKGYADAGDVFVVLGVPGTPPQIGRETGFREGLASSAPGIQIKGAQPGNWDQTKASEAASALFTQFGSNVKGVYAQADNMMAGVIVAAQRAGIDPSKLVLVGSNCSIEGVTAIESGTQYATVLQSPVQDGEYAAQAVADLLDGKKPENVRYLPQQIITKANINDCNTAVGR
ncbi:ABC-type sugar transport system substrate-binding protein [Pseudomonas hunanensis]|uniref:ABC-type sugar transport system substrate-binding protein n=1 Tax=Pseudomonas hunanensis TaxID=1247546 RepID=A0ACC6JY30_9PSED|nr:sugar ABC transporter substrate-binding protein [Pseudomonas hunanensis]MDR6711097.1 ABC-type sugar transport system substrate-binding protein [Pseudomonas hunanensis]